MFKVKFSHIFTSILIGCLVINTSLSPTFAQATDRDNATSLTTNIITGKGLHERDQVLYYRFTTKPGKMAITLDIDPRNGDQFSNSGLVSATLQTPDGEDIVKVSGFASIPEPVREVKRFEFEKETPVILLISIAAGSMKDYTYLLKIDGDWTELTGSAPNLRVLNFPITPVKNVIQNVRN
jgi:hypothetical protein